MVKAIKTTTTETEIDIKTPFYFRYVSEHNTDMFGVITDTYVLEITHTVEEPWGYTAYEFTKTQPKDSIYPYMFENPISKEIFDELYADVLTTLTNKGL